MATDSIAISQPNLPAPRSTVAGAMHTIFLLAVIAAWSTWGYFAALRMSTAQNPHRPAMYVLTILLEWSVVAYIAWGAKRHGSSLRELIGGKWNDSKAFLKDVAIAAGFWPIALVVLFVTALALRADKPGPSMRFMLPQSHLEMVLWVLTSLTAAFAKKSSFAGISRNNSLPGPVTFQPGCCSPRRCSARDTSTRVGNQRVSLPCTVCCLEFLRRCGG